MITENKPSLQIHKINTCKIKKLLKQTCLTAPYKLNDFTISELHFLNTYGVQDS